MNKNISQRMMVSFEDRIANNLVNCMLYLLLVLFLARDVEWVYIVATILFCASGIGLIVRWVLLFFGKVKSGRNPGAQIGNQGWLAPGFFLLYALVAYLREQPKAVLIWLIICVLTAIGAGVRFALSSRADRRV